MLTTQLQQNEFLR